jgi:Rieske Fe-S protein
MALASLSALPFILNSCTSISLISLEPEGERIAVPVAGFLPEENLKIIRSKNLEYDILLVKDQTGDHKALLMQCTHMDNILSANRSGLTCTMHGSRFDLKGQPLNGPASKPLRSFKVMEENNHLIIFLT